MISPIQGLPPLGSLGSLDKIAPGKPVTESAFLDTLKGAMNQVQQVQGDASQQVTDLLTGKGGDIHGAMIAVEKADLSFQMMMQVRNKIVSAYQEVSRMAF
jgi:flagellar hook-basal body complex protein FliE